MTENTPPSGVKVNFDGLSYLVTGMNGHTIAYLKGFLLSQALVVPEEAKTNVFTMSPKETVPGTVMDRKNGLTMGDPIENGVQILQGWVIQVTDEYVLSSSDLIVEIDK